MMTLALLQAAATPEWVGPTVAISLVVIAVTVVGVAAVQAYTALKLVGEARKLSAMIRGYQEDVTQTSRRIRRKLVRGVDNVEAKLADLETLYDLVHEEVEDTALDVAAALRTSREGNGMLGRVRRMIVPSRR